MSSDDSWRILGAARQDMGDMSMAEFIQARLIMGPLLAVALAIIGFISNIGEAIMRPLRAVFGGFSEVISATFGESVLIISAGARQAAWSIENGAASLLGPATFPLAVGTVMAGLWVLQWFWQRTEWDPFGALRSRLR